MSLRTNLFPGGKKKALTLSYDDGVIQDRRLVAMMNQHGVRGTFHLNAGTLGQENKLTADEVKTLYQNHEVSCHSLTHPDLTSLPPTAVIQEIVDDKRLLEKLVGYPIRGMSYPFGTTNQKLIAQLRGLVMEYARTVDDHNDFQLLDDPLYWRPTCHHAGKLMEFTETFLSFKRPWRMLLFYVWGHSYEFDWDRPTNNWAYMETFLKSIGGRDDIWYATNIEIVDYLNAVQSLRFSVDQSIVYNPTAQTVWIESNQEVISLVPGTLRHL